MKFKLDPQFVSFLISVTNFIFSYENFHHWISPSLPYLTIYRASELFKDRAASI